MAAYGDLAVGDGQVLTTSVGYSVQSGTNDVIKIMTDAYGNVTTETYDPTMTYLALSNYSSAAKAAVLCGLGNVVRQIRSLTTQQTIFLAVEV